VSFGASEAVKDIFPLFITVAFHSFFQLTLFGSSLLVVDMLHATGGEFGS
jgi:hypothetical protein